MYKIHSETVSIVLLGRFNPAIFHPTWFAANNLIRPEEAKMAETVMVRNEITTISKMWFDLQVLDDRFVIQTSDIREYGPLRDLVVGIFSLLPHTPIGALGLNKHFHLSIESVETWHKIGHKLAPKDDWLQILSEPGLKSMTMEGKRPDGTDGTLRIKVEPSPIVTPGLFIEFNEEHRVPKDTGMGAEWAIERIQMNWDNTTKSADSGMSGLMESMRGL